MGRGNYRLAYLFLGVAIAAQQAFALSMVEVRDAARAKSLPTPFFDEIISATASRPVTFRKADWPSYDAAGRVIRLSSSQLDTRPTDWTGMDWSHMYNEGFHAWWNTVFITAAKYNSQYRTLTSTYRAKYKEANSWYPTLAQEEGYSETAAALGLLMAKNVPFERLYYRVGYSVEAVGHSDRPGYSPKAEEIYPNPQEYRALFFWMTGKYPPEAPGFESEYIDSDLFATAELQDRQ